MKTDGMDLTLDPAVSSLDEKLRVLGGDGLDASVDASWRRVREYVERHKIPRRIRWQHHFAAALAVALPVAIVAIFAVALLNSSRQRAVPAGGPPGRNGQTATPNGQPVTLTRVAMWGDSGWATADQIGAAPKFGNQSGAVLHTSDGGRTWSRTGITHSDLAAFIDAQHARTATFDAAAVSAYTINVTNDGGVTWRHGADINLCCAPAQLIFTDPEHGWALSLPNGVVGPTSVAFVWRTIDGGVTWIDVTAAAKRALPLGCQHYGLGSVDASTALLVAGNCPSFFIEVTHDGGLTWRQQASPTGLPMGDMEPWAPPSASGNLLISGVGGNGAIAAPAGVLVTTDGGTTWRYMSLPDVPEDAGQPGARPITDLRDAGDWWFVGGSAPAAPGVYHSTDNGLTWLRTATLHGFTVTWLDADGSHVRLLTSGGDLLSSGDGGRTFTDVAPHSAS